MSFADFRTTWRDKILPNVFLNTDLHAEAVNYTPVNGVLRAINVHVVDTAELDMQEEAEIWEDTITVKTMKDALLGIDDPQLGDQIVRASPHDVDSRPYMYQGTIESQDRDSWRLTFARSAKSAAGSKTG